MAAVLPFEFKASKTQNVNFTRARNSDVLNPNHTEIKLNQLSKNSGIRISTKLLCVHAAGSVTVLQVRGQQPQHQVRLTLKVPAAPCEPQCSRFEVHSGPEPDSNLGHH